MFTEAEAGDIQIQRLLGTLLMFQFDHYDTRVPASVACSRWPSDNSNWLAFQ